MRFSILLGLGRYRIQFSTTRAVLFDRLFNAASHHYWHARNAADDSPHGDYHRELAAAHSNRLSRMIAAMDFSEALDPDGAGLNRPSTWTDPKLSPIITGDFYCNMLPDIRYPFGEAHLDDRLLFRVISNPEDPQMVTEFLENDLTVIKYPN